MMDQHLRLALHSLRRHPWLTLLMVLAVGFGIGATMTSATVFRGYAANPLAHREGELFHVQLYPWAVPSPFDTVGGMPDALTWRDGTALLEARAAKRQVLMYPNEFMVAPAGGRAPFLAPSRLTTPDFFAMFEAPFAHGGAWTQAQDAAAARVVVLSHPAALRAFGRTDVVGERLRVGGQDFRVAGVLAPWRPLPRVYDLRWPLEAPEDLYLPLRIGFERELRSTRGNNCIPSFTGSYATMLTAECVWLTLWIEVDGAAGAAAYGELLDAYAESQHAAGRALRRGQWRLRSVAQWLDDNGVVRPDTRAQTALSLAFLAACLVNTVGLLLAKFLAQARQISVQRALGASRRQVFAQYLTEAGLVGVLGSVLGVALTALGAAALRGLDPALADVARLDAPMTAATVALALAATLASGAFPAWRACRLPPAAHLKSE